MLMTMSFSRRITLFVLIIISVGLFGCMTETSNSVNTPLAASETTESVSTGYPVSADPATAYIVPSNITPTPIPEQPVPNPVGDLGVLVGYVFSSATGKPIVNVPLQLAEVFRQNGEGVYVLDAAQSPFALADVTGKFVFSDVMPGEYFLVVGSVEAGGYRIVEGEPNVGRPFFVTAGETTEIGNLSVDEIVGFETTD
jgi:hypothetical protein